eukprot:CAMPEP_0206048906 /NCGR_PEP_ID=MMETSP1466-20131121/25403_1 /ASSEMBLY_ACC=CAM_ASM_001126 /TAXON_ID=44452 /ORGANISM="Pavlova gyrans, Strain CCMP608" /LENGTH=402 /DNA_ID=CAMNT_0053423983 /DNA_START=67 /DNA_END=1276 /DNA_ORIENTATION=+
MPAVEHQREAELIAALRARVSDLTPPKRMPFDDACLARYLRARNMQVGPAADALHATVAWRAQFGADDMRAPKFMHHLEVETATLKSIVAPFQDRKGRPVVVIDPSRENSTSKDGNIALAIYNMERAIATAPNPQSVEASSVLFIFNCKGLSPRAGPSLSTTLAEARILQAHYPERLGQALVLDAPGFIGDFWNVLRRAVDPNSREKVQFLSTKTAEGRAKLDSIIDTSLLTPWHGGTAASEPYPDSRVYLHPEVDPLAYDPTSTSSQADPQRSKLESTDGAVGAGGGFTSASSPTRRDPRDPCDLRQSGSQTAPTALTYPLQARRRTRALNTQARPQGRPRNPASTNLTAAPESACPAASRIGAKRTAPHQMCYGVLPRACRAVGATTMAQVRGTASRGGV